MEEQKQVWDEGQGRTTGKPDERRRPVKPRGCRVKAQPETWKSMVEAERQLTDVELK